MVARRIVAWSAVTVALACIGLLTLQVFHPFNADYLDVNTSNSSRYRMPVVPPVLCLVGIIALIVASYQLEAIFVIKNTIADEAAGQQGDDEMTERNPDPR